MNKKLMLNGQEVEVDIEQISNEEVLFSYEGKKYLFKKKYVTDRYIELDDHGQKLNFPYTKVNRQFFVDIDGVIVNIEGVNKKRSKKNKVEDKMTSPMPGKIISILFKKGDLVKKGDSLLILEAMKMEHTIKANKDGVIKEIVYKKNDLVEGNIELISIG